MIPASTSRLIDGLVGRGLIDRQDSPAQASYRATQAAYTARFSTLPPSTLPVIVQAMEALRPIFCGETDAVS